MSAAPRAGAGAPIRAAGTGEVAPRGAAPAGVGVGLAAAVVAMEAGEPAILLAPPEPGEGAGALPGLPAGPFDPLAHRTFEAGLRAFVAGQTGFDLGHVEQLYTFGDRGRQAGAEAGGRHVVSVGYLALTRPGPGEAPGRGARFRPWYAQFPWEDWRAGRPPALEALLPALRAWACDRGDEARGPARALTRAERVSLSFGPEAPPCDAGPAPPPTPWDEERVLERYELLYEAGLVEEARRDGREAALARPGPLAPGLPLRHDHRRILATAMGRLRAKLKYRPLVFELMPEAFTLTELQRTVEALAGHPLHKQNFRRLVEGGALVERLGTRAETGGRPAALFRFRREVLAERPAPGLRVGARG